MITSRIRPAPFHRRGLSTTATIVIALLAGCSMHLRLDTNSPTKTIAKLTAQANAWDRAIVRKDRPAIEANIADDFRNIDSSGGVTTKRAFVEQLVSSDLEIDPYTVDEFDVRVYGDVALLSGRTDMTGRFKSKPFTSHYRYTDVYAKRDGEWKVVSVQTTQIPKE